MKRYITRKFVALSSLGAVAAVGLGLSIPGAPGVIQGAGADLMTLMRARSPGDRDPGAQTSKREPVMASLAQATPAAAPAPVSRVLSTAAPAAVAPAAVPPVAIAAPAAVAPVAPALAASPVIAAAPVAAAGLPAGAGALALLPLVPLLDNGGGRGGDTPAPPIPEPATWMMMILGFGVVGTVIRRRRRGLARSGAADGGLSAVAR
ncbi:MAG TPA: PEPxxWA-CTERM sorting domain-containing protein [Sphingomicrobium sp.]|nr:PEPxxWA-CTERM sorting domain-containing protein [Sphingomicrobium sp.]